MVSLPGRLQRIPVRARSGSRSSRGSPATPGPQGRGTHPSSSGASAADRLAPRRRRDRPLVPRAHSRLSRLHRVRRARMRRPRRGRAGRADRTRDRLRVCPRTKVRYGSDMARATRRKRLVHRIPGCRHLGPLRAASGPTGLVGYAIGKGRRTTSRRRRPSRRRTDGTDPADRAGAGVLGGRAHGGAEGGWLTNGGTLFNQRYSPLDEIDTSNVERPEGRLDDRLAARASPPSTPAEAQPIVYDGVMYVPTGADDVFAVERRDRQGALAVRGEARPEDQHRLLRLAQPRRRARRRQGLPRPARRPLVALDQRPARSSGRRRSQLAGGLHDHRARRSTTTGWSITGISGGEYSIRGRVQA